MPAVGNGAAGMMPVDDVYPAAAFDDAPWLEHACEIEVVKVVDEGISPGSMRGWFAGCANLISCELSRLDTSKVVDMSWMFYGCENLRCIDLSGFDTRLVASFERMFCGCEKLRRLDLSGFSVSNGADVGGMFWDCCRLSRLECAGLSFEAAQAPKVHPFERCWRLPRRQIADIVGGLPYGCWVDCEHCGDYFWHYIVFGTGNVPKGAVTPGFMVAKLLIVLAGWTCSVAILIWLAKALS